MLLNFVLSCTARVLEIRANNQNLLDSINNLEGKNVNKVVDSEVPENMYKVTTDNISFETGKIENATSLINIAHSLGEVPADMVDILSHLKTLKPDKEEIKSGNRNFAIIFTNDAETLLELKGIENEEIVKFFIVTDENQAHKYECTFPGILAFNAAEKNFLRLPIIKNVQSLISSIVLPSLVKISQENFRHLQSLEQRTFYVIENSSKFDEFKEKYNEMTKACSSIGKFIFFAPEDVPSLITLLNTNESEYPLLVSLSKDSKAIVRNVTPENFLSGVHKLTTNSAEKLIFNSEIPSDNETRPVKVVNTKTFADFTSKKDGDVLIAFTSPRCGYCRALEPVLEKFSTILMEKNVPINIGNYNVNENEEQPNFVASGVPTLYFKKASGTEFIKMPNDVRSLSDLLNFIAKEGESSYINIEDYSEHVKKSTESPVEESESFNMEEPELAEEKKEEIKEETKEEETKEREVL